MSNLRNRGALASQLGGVLTVILVTLAPASGASAEPNAPTPAGSAEVNTPTPTGSAESAPRLSLLEVVRTTLALHPNIAAARAALAASSAVLSAARGPFDPHFQSALSHTRDVIPVLAAQRVQPEQRAAITDSTQLSVGAALTTHVGTRLVPRVSLIRLHQRYDGQPAGMPGTNPYQLAQVGLEVTQPLLRGAGRLGAAGGLETARLARGATEHLVGQTAQDQVLSSINAYWRLVAAERQLGLLQTNQAAAERLVRDTSELVASDQRRRSDLRPLLGNLANRRRSVAEAENERAQARHALGLAMGLGLEQSRDWHPAEPLPKVSLSLLGATDAVRRARSVRSDVQAAQARVAAATNDLRAAEYNTRPTLDLTATLGYAGALDRDGVDAFLAASARNVRGVNAGLSLSLDLPFENTAQRADRDLKRARFEQERIAAADLERSYPVAVADALVDLRLSASALEAATEAVAQYQLVIQDQREELHAGVGTVIDLILTEDLLVNAQQSQIINHLRYAQAVTRLLFETGALPRANAGSARAVALLMSGGS